MGDKPGNQGQRFLGGSRGSTINYEEYRCVPGNVERIREAVKTITNSRGNIHLGGEEV